MAGLAAQNPPGAPEATRSGGLFGCLSAGQRRWVSVTTGTTILKVENGLITEEVGLDDGVSVLRQLGLIDEG